MKYINKITLIVLYRYLTLGHRRNYKIKLLGGYNVFRDHEF